MKQGRKLLRTAIIAAGGLLLFSIPSLVAADIPDQTSSGSIGLQGTISTAPPTRGATITTPGNGASFNTTPITVGGLCPTGVLVKVFSNNVFVGSTVCQNGS